MIDLGAATQGVGAEAATVTVEPVAPTVLALEEPAAKPTEAEAASSPSRPLPKRRQALPPAQEVTARKVAVQTAPAQKATGRHWAWALGVFVTSLAVVAAVLFGGHFLWQAGMHPVEAVEGPMDSVSVTGRQGSQPVLSLDRPVDVYSAKLRVEKRGDGRTITEDSPVLVALTAFDGKTGANLNPDGAANLLLASASQTDLGELLSSLLIGSTEGSRLVVARPLEDGSTEIDVVDVLYTIAKGEVNPDSSGPLAVSFSDDGPVVSRGAEPPSDLVVQVLNTGTGAQVAATDVVVVQYLAGTWADGRIVGSTWAAGAPVMIDLESSMPGVRDALVDQRVGSRLAVTIPAEMATGEDNLFVVVDILGAMPAANTDAPTDQIGQDIPE